LQKHSVFLAKDIGVSGKDSVFLAEHIGGLKIHSVFLLKNMRLSRRCRERSAASGLVSRRNPAPGPASVADSAQFQRDFMV
jgi:hypothetical protein